MKGKRTEMYGAMGGGGGRETELCG